MQFFVLAVALGASCALVVPSSMQPVSRMTAARRAVQPTCAADKAVRDTNKALLKASKKVTLIAKGFGVTQGKAAQAWVQEALKQGEASGDLMTMQLSLFEECTLDDDSGKCKALSEAMEALTTAVEEREKAKEAEDPDEFTLVLGATPIQQAASKLRFAASQFGPEQKAAADAWMKRVTSGKGASTTDLLEQEVALFGECVLSEGSTPSACEQLEQSLAALQEAIALEVYYGNIVVPGTDDSEEGVEADEEEASEAAASLDEPTAQVSGRKRAAVKRFLSTVTSGKVFPTAAAQATATEAEAQPAAE